MPTLVLVRHAQAAHNYPDRARPLTDAGRDQAARLGATLAREVGAFDVAVSSDAQRARETFAAILARAGADESWYDRSIYDGGEKEIIELACTFTGEACLIVGHEPVISYAGYILARQEDRGAADRGSAHRHCPRPLLRGCMGGSRARNVRHAGLLHPAHPIGDVPRGGGHGLVPDPVTVFTFVHVSATHIGKGSLNAIECAGIYPPNREK